MSRKEWNEDKWNRRKTLKLMSNMGVAGIFMSAANPAAAKGSQNNSIPYTDLSSIAQQMFDEALSSKSRKEYNGVDFPEEFFRYKIVTYKGSRYNLNRSVDGKTYHGFFPEKTSKETTEERARVVQYDEIPERGKNMVNNAIVHGKFKTRERLPDVLKGFVGCVVKNGQYYTLNKFHQDKLLCSISPSRTE